MLVIDGSYGEGGGQVLRTALSLAAILEQPVRIERIRAGRRRPGLQAQHLTAVRAAAAVCRAELRGAEMNSQTLTFTPRTPPQAGEYSFDVAEARGGRSAGSVTLVLQTILMPLLLAPGTSRVTLHGGTHVHWSPPVHYLEHIYRPMLARMGLSFDLKLVRWGWHPVGGGEVQAKVRGIGGREKAFTGIEAVERGKLRRLWGFSATSNLPAHIRERQYKQVMKYLGKRGFQPQLETIEAPAPGPGTCVFLVAEYEHIMAGFSAYGRLGKPAERVAEEACRDFLRYHQSEAAVEPHLADQLILPLALAGSPSRFTTSAVTEHLRTNAWVVEQFLDVTLEIEENEDGTGLVTILP